MIHLYINLKDGDPVFSSVVKRKKKGRFHVTIKEMQLLSQWKARVLERAPPSVHGDQPSHYVKTLKPIVMRLVMRVVMPLPTFAHKPRLWGIGV